MTAIPSDLHTSLPAGLTCESIALSALVIPASSLPRTCRAHSCSCPQGRQRAAVSSVPPSWWHVRDGSEGQVSKSGDGLCPARHRTGWLTTCFSAEVAMDPFEFSSPAVASPSFVLDPLRKPTTQPMSCVAMPYGSRSQAAPGPPNDSCSSAAGLLRTFRKP